jgi:hypothetical protein
VRGQTAAPSDAWVYLAVGGDESIELGCFRVCLIGSGGVWFDDNGLPLRIVIRWPVTWLEEVPSAAVSSRCVYRTWRGETTPGEATTNNGDRYRSPTRP